MSDPVTATMIAGGLGLAGNIYASDKASSAASKASKNQDALTARQTALFDKIYGLVSDADKSGEFNPEKRISQVQGDLTKQQGIATANTGATLKGMGYKPGDGTIADQVGGVNAKYSDEFARLTNEIRNDAFNRKLSAYRSVDPTALNPAIQTASNQANYYQQKADSVDYSGVVSLISQIPNMKKTQPEYSLGTGYVRPGSFVSQ